MTQQAAAEVLTALLVQAQSPETAIRQKAEAHLQQATLHHGFGHALVQATVRQDLPSGLRQMAALLLKQHVREHWTPEAETFKDPIIGDDEKAAIRSDILQGLADPNSKIRTAVGMVVATVARWDVPDVWPTLLSDLVAAIGTKQNADLVAGSVRCLALFCDELADEQVAQVVPVLLPLLLDIISQPESYKSSIQRKAIAVFHNCVTLIINMTGPWKLHSKQLLSPYLDSWLQQFCVILACPLKAQISGSSGAVRLEVLKALVICSSYLGKLVAKFMPSILQHCWALLVDCLPIFEKSITSGEDADGEVDSEGDNLDFQSLIAQLLEFFITLAGSSRFRNLLTGVLDQLVFVTTGYMQMTGAQADAWEQDINQYVADEEEETFSVRTSGELLLGELMTAFPSLTAKALNKAVQVRFMEAAEAKAAAKIEWWKLREAALLAVGSVADDLVSSSSHVEPDCFQVSGFLENILQEDLGTEGVPMFLQGRALWVAAKMADAVSPRLALPFLQASASGISSGRPPSLQVGACRALSMLCTKLDPSALQPILPSLYEGLGGLLSVFGEETLHLVLETLAALIKAHSKTAAQWELHITQPMLHIWAAHVNDPMLVLDTIDIFEALAAIPTALPNLQGRALPVLASIVSKPEENKAVLVEGALDLAVVLLRPSSPQSAASVHGILSGPVMSHLRHCDDTGILQSCCEYLRTLISIGGTDVLTWGGTDPENTLKEILAALARLLHPDTGDSAPLYVGQVVTALLQKIPSSASAAIAYILPAALAKLAVATSSPLIVGLLAIFAQLIHVNVTQLVNHLAAMQSPSGTGSALDFLLQIWTEHVLDFHGTNEIKLSTTALAMLLASRHPALNAIQVKGKRLDTGEGIRTRAKAKHQQEQWQWVPVPIKLFSILADTLIEAREGAGGPDEDEWEEVSDSEDGSQAPSSYPGGLQAIQSLGIPHTILQAAQDDDDGSTGLDIEDNGPLAHVDCTTYVCGQMTSLAHQDTSLFEGYCSFLNPVQLEAVRACFSAA